MVINPLLGVYMPIISISYFQVGMTIHDVGLAARLSIAGKPGGCADESSSWNTTSQVCRPLILVVPELVGVKKPPGNGAETGKATCFLGGNSETADLENSRSSSTNFKYSCPHLYPHVMPPRHMLVT